MKSWKTLAYAAMAHFALATEPAHALDQELIDKAIANGVAALRSCQNKDGSWSYPAHGGGMTPLAALTLLECGAGADDPAVAKAAELVRRGAGGLRETYSISLAILFLDRLGKPADESTIQGLAGRLLSGQTKAGSWSYQCPSTIPVGAADDHSNTQFATLALWVGRRHKVAADQALKGIEAHYRQCQSPADGGWCYTVTANPASTQSSPTMTAAGILGLAAGRAVSVDAEKRLNAKAGNVPDPALNVALKALGDTIRDPVGPRRLTVPGLIPTATGNSFYFLWSLERVAMCLGLETISRHDWYTWGAEILVVNQDRNTGHWKGEFSPGPDTCFALLFLSRSNLAKDMTANLRGMFRDPRSVTLRGGIGGPSVTGGRTIKPAIEAGGQRERTLPDNASSSTPSRVGVDAGRLAEEIVRAPAERFDAVLQRIRDARGVVHTEALAAAIPQLPRENKKKARDALAERLSSLRVATLTEYLADDNAEIRRGAALALAMKESTENIPNLIRLLRDPDEAVVLGARAALRAMTHQDFGPKAGASPEERRRASASSSEWRRKNRGSVGNANP